MSDEKECVQQTRSNNLLGIFARMLRNQIDPGHSKVIECRLGRDYAISLAFEIEQANLLLSTHRHNTALANLAPENQSPECRIAPNVK